MSYTKTAILPVTPDEAFALITQPERLRRWQTVSARVDLRAGGEYRWTVTPGHVAAGTYREVEPGRRVVFGWGWEGNSDLGPDASTVTITVETSDGGTLVTLVHEGLTEEQTESHAEGWNHYFTRLEKVAADGDAGPDEWAAAPAQLDAVMAAQAIEAWRTRGTAGMVPASVGGGMPAYSRVSIMSLEFLPHGWDFEQASGQQFPVSDEVVAYVLPLADPIIPAGRARGAFAAEVNPPADATPLQRLVAFSGRSPVHS